MGQPVVHFEIVERDPEQLQTCSTPATPRED
jgi:hypothetical protein